LNAEEGRTDLSDVDPAGIRATVVDQASPFEPEQQPVGEECRENEAAENEEELHVRPSALYVPPGLPPGSLLSNTMTSIFQAKEEP
jgi:hypothetical protein